MNHLLSWAFLLVTSGLLLAHPITESAEMPYPGPVSVEEHALGPLEELSLSEPQEAAAAIRLSTLLPVDVSRDGYHSNLSGAVGDHSAVPRNLSPHLDLRTAGLLSRPLTREAAVYSPISHVLGIRKHFRKRAGTADCFWKYCV